MPMPWAAGCTAECVQGLCSKSADKQHAVHEAGPRHNLLQGCKKSEAADTSEGEHTYSAHACMEVHHRAALGDELQHRPEGAVHGPKVCLRKGLRGQAHVRQPDGLPAGTEQAASPVTSS